MTRPTSSLLIGGTLFFQLYVCHALSFNTTSYPLCAQDILSAFANTSTCASGLIDPNTVNFDGSPAYVDPTYNYTCLCSNNNWEVSSAQYIYALCSCSDLQGTATGLSNECKSAGTKSVLNVDAFIAAGDSTESICGQQANTPGSNTPESKHGLDSGSVIGLAVGIPAALLTLATVVVAALQLLVSQRVIPESASPWPVIRESFAYWCCCCCQGRKKPREVSPGSGNASLITLPMPAAVAPVGEPPSSPTSVATRSDLPTSPNLSAVSLPVTIPTNVDASSQV